MRKEADDSGPLTELEHWKRMSAKFNYIIEQIKGPSCKAVINVLNIAHSKLLKVKALHFKVWHTSEQPTVKLHFLNCFFASYSKIMCLDKCETLSKAFSYTTVIFRRGKGSREMKFSFLYFILVLNILHINFDNTTVG